MVDGTPPSLSKAFREAFLLPKLMANPIIPPIRVAEAGEGQPVIVIPGMMSGDSATTFLRRSLTASGFDARPSGLLFNTGATQRRLDLVRDAVIALQMETGSKVALVGWSLGGLFARLLGHRMPDHIECVVSLGSPFSGDPHANHAWKLYELLNGHKVTHSPFPEDVSVKPTVQTIAVWSQNDGVISPESARGRQEERDEDVEVKAAHMEMATDESCVREVIGILARQWKKGGEA